MHDLEFYIPSKYDNPLSASGRGRTIAAFHLLQDNSDVLTKDKEMRRDILSKLMSPSAVNYWLNEKNWLEKGNKIGRVQLLKLTSKGISVCRNSASGGSDTPTTKELITNWRNKLTNGAPSLTKSIFPPVVDES
tara:strand:+ start:1851 stop:2252 length:402 start_codon:yes stop_codon:yes gene_type:complete